MGSKRATSADLAQKGAACLASHLAGPEEEEQGSIQEANVAARDSSREPTLRFGRKRGPALLPGSVWQAANFARGARVDGRAGPILTSLHL